MPPHPLTNFEIKDYYENEPRLEHGAYVINLHEYGDVGTHWIALYVKDNKVIFFDSLGIEHVPKEMIRFIGSKNIKTSILRI